MATNENSSIKSLNELLWMFMRQAAVETKSRRARRQTSQEPLPSEPRAAERRGSKE